MPIANRWDINYGAKTISRNGNESSEPPDTVLDLYKHLMDLFDDSAQMDDDIPMSAQWVDRFTMLNGWTIPDASMESLKSGAITMEDGTVWSNPYTIGTVPSTSQVYIYQDGAELPTYWGLGHIDILVKTSNAGTLIDSGKLLIMARDYGYTYDHVEYDFSGGGRSAIALAVFEDANNDTAEGTVSGYSGITITPGNVSRDLNNGNGSQTYATVVDCNNLSLKQVYEYLKLATKHNSSIPNGGEAYIAADPGFTPIKSAPFGTYAGGKFFGAQGVWLANVAAVDATNYQLIDSAGVDQIPPNTVPISVNALEVGDRVAIFELTGEGGTIVPQPALWEAVALSSTFQTTTVYTTDIHVTIRVRQYGFLPFEVPGVITSTGLSAAAVRVVDGVVS